MQDREDRIRRKAYELWMEEGQPEGRQSAHWEEASELVAFDEARNTLNPRKLDDDARNTSRPSAPGQSSQDQPSRNQPASGIDTDAGGRKHSNAESGPEAGSFETAPPKSRSRARASASAGISSHSGESGFIHREMREESTDGSGKASASAVVKLSRRTGK